MKENIERIYKKFRNSKFHNKNSIKTDELSTKGRDKSKKKQKRNVINYKLIRGRNKRNNIYK